MNQLTSQQIRLLRLSRGMGQKEVAAKMDNISKQRYSQLENHKGLLPETLLKILKALDYTFESAKKYLDSIPPTNIVADR